MGEKLRYRHDPPSHKVTADKRVNEEKLRFRHDGFTPKKQRKFLKVLRKTGCVRDACRKVGITSTSAYRTRGKLPGFARQWQTALDQAASDIEILAWDRAMHGVEEVTIRNGEVWQVKRKPSDGVFRLIMQGANPRKYGRIGRGGETVKQIETRIRAEIRNRRLARPPTKEEREMVEEFMAYWNGDRAEELAHARQRAADDIEMLKEAHRKDQERFDALYAADPDGECEFECTEAEAALALIHDPDWQA